MDYKKTNAPSNTVTRDMMDLCADTGNIYETMRITSPTTPDIISPPVARKALMTGGVVHGIRT